MTRGVYRKCRHQARTQIAAKVPCVCLLTAWTKQVSGTARRHVSTCCQIALPGNSTRKGIQHRKHISEGGAEVWVVGPAPLHQPEQLLRTAGRRVLQARPASVRDQRRDLDRVRIFKRKLMKCQLEEHHGKGIDVNLLIVRVTSEDLWSDPIASADSFRHDGPVVIRRPSRHAFLARGFATRHTEVADFRRRYAVGTTERLDEQQVHALQVAVDNGRVQCVQVVHRAGSFLGDPEGLRPSEGLLIFDLHMDVIRTTASSAELHDKREGSRDGRHAQEPHHIRVPDPG
mmetsp:Transcript_43004/g.111488  ORF Transcript_43004/g.111488 Transcript_43004/m.111488 type:complete len:287 (-) Transcript_43004:265-1125(-)